MPVGKQKQKDSAAVLRSDAGSERQPPSSLAANQKDQSKEGKDPQAELMAAIRDKDHRIKLRKTGVAPTSPSRNGPSKESKDPQADLMAAIRNKDRTKLRKTVVAPKTDQDKEESSDLNSALMTAVRDAKGGKKLRSTTPTTTDSKLSNPLAQSFTLGLQIFSESLSGDDFQQKIEVFKTQIRDKKHLGYLMVSGINSDQPRAMLVYCDAKLATKENEFKLTKIAEVPRVGPEISAFLKDHPALESFKIKKTSAAKEGQVPDQIIKYLKAVLKELQVVLNKQSFNQDPTASLCFIRHWDKTIAKSDSSLPKPAWGNLLKSSILNRRKDMQLSKKVSDNNDSDSDLDFGI